MKASKVQATTAEAAVKHAPKEKYVAPPVPTDLPRRQPGAIGINDTLTPQRNGVSWKEFFRLRNSTSK